MALRFTNKKAVQNFLENQKKRIEALFIYNLEAMVVDLQNHAKLNAGYENRTSNLISSIGGTLLKDKVPVTYKGFTGNSEGSKAGMIFLESLIPNASDGYTIIIVAGMSYATYVENYHGLNVLKKTELKMLRDLPKLVQSLKKKLK